jgi:hypothetical protein
MDFFRKFAEIFNFLFLCFLSNFNRARKYKIVLYVGQVTDVESCVCTLYLKKLEKARKNLRSDQNATILIGKLLRLNHFFIRNWKISIRSIKSDLNYSTNPISIYSPSTKKRVRKRFSMKIT